MLRLDGKWKHREDADATSPPHQSVRNVDVCFNLDQDDGRQEIREIKNGEIERLQDHGAHHGENVGGEAGNDAKETLESSKCVAIEAQLQQRDANICSEVSDNEQMPPSQPFHSGAFSRTGPSQRQGGDTTMQETLYVTSQVKRNSRRQQREREILADDYSSKSSEDDDDSSSQENLPGAVHIPGIVRSPQAVSEDEGQSYNNLDSATRSPSTIITTSPIVAELAPSENEVAARVRIQLIEEITGEVVLASAIPEVPVNQHEAGRRKWLIPFSIFVALVVGVAIAVVLSKDNPHSVQTTGRRDYLLEVLGPYIITDLSTAAFASAESAQYKAIEWMAYYDTFSKYPTNNQTTSVLLERYVLVMLYYSTSSGIPWKKINWLAPTTVCAWNVDRTMSKLEPKGWTWLTDTLASGGAYCNSDGNVTGLQLSTLGLKGKIPWELSLLANLNFIDLTDNSLSGTIPAELYMQTNLEYFRVSGNTLTGSIPSELAGLTNLEYLSFESNHYKGRLPSHLGLLTKLTYLSVYMNEVIGSIPSEFSLLSNLVEIRVDENKLTGSLPSEISFLTKLAIFSVGVNQLTGRIPSEYSSWTKMQYLSFGTNQFTGSLPSDFGDLTQLTSFYVHKNQLTGTIPTKFGNLTNLKDFYFYSNTFTGNVDRIFCINFKMNVLNLQGDCNVCACCDGC